MPDNDLSRRDFLYVAFASIWGFFLAACGMADETPTPTATATSTPTETPEPQSASNDPLPATETPTAAQTSTPEPCFSLLEPADGVEVGSIGRITFAWEPQNGASSYKLLITLPNDLIEEYPTEFTQFEKYLESLPLNGEYRWQVIAFDETLGELCVAEAFTFIKVATQRPGRNSGDSGGNNGGTTTVTMTSTSNDE